MDTLGIIKKIIFLKPILEIKTISIEGHRVFLGSDLWVQMSLLTA